MSPSRRRRRASPAWEGRPTIRVATLPGRGLYARHLGHPEGVDAVYRTTVGMPGSAPRRASFDSRVADREPRHRSTSCTCTACGRARPPTRSRRPPTPSAPRAPRWSSPATTSAIPAAVPTRRYAAQLDALVPQADAVVTLTESAAEEMRRRWAVDPLVLPHPHAVDFVRMRQPRPARHTELRVGTHLAGLAVPTDPVRLVDALTRAIRGMDDVRLSVHVHETVLDAGSSTYDLASVRRDRRHGPVRRRGVAGAPPVLGVPAVGSPLRAGRLGGPRAVRVALGLAGGVRRPRHPGSAARGQPRERPAAVPHLRGRRLGRRPRRLVREGAVDGARAGLRVAGRSRGPVGGAGARGGGLRALYEGLLGSTAVSPAR